MTLTLDLVLLIVAFVCFLLAAFNLTDTRFAAVRFIGLGLAAWVLTLLV